jgi:hypothetical protein
MANVSLMAGSSGPMIVNESDYAHPDCVMRREDIEVLGGTSGLSVSITVVTDVGVFNGIVKKRTKILTFTDGLIIAVSDETAWS